VSFVSTSSPFFSPVLLMTTQPPLFCFFVFYTRAQKTAVNLYPQNWRSKREWLHR
jgi:hypothetical protein